jgi:hypothetical protein
MARTPSRKVGTLADIARHGQTLTLNCERCCHRKTMDLEAMILADGETYLLRKIVDRAICSKCGGVEISVTLGISGPAFSYPSPSP